jgi:hypothetical protein
MTTKEANEFDCDLYRLIGRAQMLRDRAGYARSYRKQWGEVVAGLLAVRPKVRAMMSEKDRAETV